MSIREQVLGAMRQVGAAGATYAEIHRLLGGAATEQQIRVSLYRLSDGGYLRCEQGGPVDGGGKAPGRFYLREQRLVKTKQRPSRVRDRRPSFPMSSPWTMAAGIDMPWPPKFEGGRVYQQLGPWNAPDPMEGGAAA